MVPHISIDLNCDLGEGMVTDASIMPYISSANIACGYHAGDTDTMQQTIALCNKHGVAIGAHPSFPGRSNFGRIEMTMSETEIASMLLKQLEIMQTLCAEAGTTLHHVKPHGALYNMSARNPLLAATIANVIEAFNPALFLYGLAGSCSITAAEKVGLPVVHECFADRTYQDDGSLTPRSQPTAVITDSNTALQQALNIAENCFVFSVNGKRISIGNDDSNEQLSICLHGDGEHAVEFASLIHHTLTEKGIQIMAPSFSKFF